ncbi:hypothetical protein BAR1_03655 [Profundibacter amoris]|uniref:Uncharacterized protein n=1 Tax=Profundibacter amoris TaxID=2171755 RepID=A0A347UE26_9RHOB|nr:hypothetical protein BAR1_03655 [Profundibacter amoris]
MSRLIGFPAFIGRTEAAFAVAIAFGPVDEFNLVRHAQGSGLGLSFAAYWSQGLTNTHSFES